MSPGPWIQTGEATSGSLLAPSGVAASRNKGPSLGGPPATHPDTPSAAIAQIAIDRNARRAGAR
ncbi:hypothetical protein GCM10009101_27520 [Brevundimonas lenta]